MRNLFIMHTQYNLILACGLAKTRFKDDTNELVVYAEFSLNDRLREKLESCFNKVYYIQEAFTFIKEAIKNELYLFKCLKKSKCFIRNNYDNVFLSQEREYDTYIISKLSKHCDFKCYSIEEDVYFSVDNARNKEGYAYVRKKTFRHNVRNLFRDILFGKNKYYEEVHFYGMNSNYDGAFVLFKNAVRKELAKRNIEEISEEEIYSGIDCLYGDIDLDIPVAEKTVLFYFDLIERYKDKDALINFVKNIVEICKNNSVGFLYKYHPRETEKFSFLTENNNFCELPLELPSERISLALKGSEVAVLANLTTALWVSSKMGMKGFSIAKLENPDNLVAALALEKIGITVPKSFGDLEKYLRSWIKK